MKSIICDTNVWYLLNKEPDYKPESADLILTASCYFDWFASNRMDPTHPKHQNLLDSYASAKTHHKTKLITDPFDFAATRIAGYKILDRTTASFHAAEKCLDEMLVKVYNTKQINNIRDACSNAKQNFKHQIITNNSILYKECSDKSKPEESLKYKLNKNCVIDHIKSWLMTFPGFSAKGEENIDWQKIEIFINTYYQFVNNKPKSPKENSMVDLLNFLYLIGNDYIYWSEEKEFLELIRQAFGNTIPEFIYPEGKIVKKIFS